MSKQTPNNQPNTPEKGPKAPEFDLSTREGVLKSYANQMNRMHEVTSALGEEDGAWEDGDTFKSGAVIRGLYEEIDQNPAYQPSEADELIAKYINAELSAVIADKSIDPEKVMQQYPEAENFTEAKFHYLDDISSKLKDHNKLVLGPKKDRKTERKNGKDVPITPGGIERIKGNIRSNFAFIGGVKRLHIEDTAKRENREISPRPVSLETFIGATKRLNENDIDQETFEKIKEGFIEEKKEQVKIATALRSLTSDKELDFVNEDFTEKVAQAPGVQKAMQNQRKEIDKAKSDLDDNDDPAQAASKSAKPSGMPPVRPRSTAQQNQGTTSSGTNESAPAQNSENQNAEARQTTATGERSSTKAESGQKMTRRDLQQIRVENAAAALQASSLSRSKQFMSATEAEALHAAFSNEVYELMQFDRPPILDDPSVTQAEKNAFISKYAFDQYHKVTQDTVDSMGGEKDPKKRKRNARILRLGGFGLGFVLGGPAGAAIGGAIGLGISKGLDSNMKKREELKGAVTRYEAQNAADTYLADTPDRQGEAYSEKAAFEAATMNLMRNFENGLVKRRRLNIAKSALIGAAWTAGTMVVAHEAAAAMQYAGDQLYQFASKASWSGTGASWEGGLNPNFNYTVHEKPVSMSVLGGLFKAATPELGLTAGAAILAGFGAIKLAQDGPDAKKKKNKNNQSQVNAA